MTGSVLERQTSKYSDVSLVIVKVNHRCNLACEYCYENIVRGNDLSPDTAVQFAEEILNSTHHKRVTFVFHGGEPTLAEMGWYLYVVAEIRRLARAAHKIVTFGMQTNLVKVTDTQADLYADLGISLSASIDGAHGTPQQRQLSSKVARNFLRLKHRGVRLGVLSNINTANWNHAKELVVWLEQVLGVTTFKANLSHAVGAGYHGAVLTPEQAFCAQRIFIDHLINTGGHGATEDNVALEILRLFRYAPTGYEEGGAPQHLCLGRHCGAGKKVVSISSSGAVLPCGRFSWDERQFRLSTVGASGDEADYRLSINRFHSAHAENWGECSVCDAREVCSFGCQAFIVRSEAKRNIECLPTKVRYDYLVKHREQLAGVAPIIARRYSNRLSTQLSNRMEQVVDE